MKAAQLVKFGGNEAIAIKILDRPDVTAGKVLIEVYAAGVNPVDWKIRAGMMKIPLPATLGGDFSGVVKKIGPGVPGFKGGDEVYGQTAAYRGGSGSFEEFALADQKTIALKPKSLSHLEAGAIPLVGVSALQALVDTMNLTGNQKILIHGGGGGIGSMAIQLAKYRGATVATTVSSVDIEYVKDLGADRAIDFNREKFYDMVRDYDAVLDLVGGETYRKSFDVLRKGGIIVSLLEMPDKALMEQHGVRAISQSTQVNTDRLTRLAELVDRGFIRVHIDKIFPLEQTGEALGYLETRHPRGKVVVDISATIH